MKSPQIIYLHQAIPFQKEMNFSFFKKDEIKYAIIQKFLGKRIIKGLSNAEGIIVQTNWMKKSVIKLTAIKDEIIQVVPPKIKVDDNNLFSEPNLNTFFYPTGDDIYKNIGIIERSAELINNLDFKVELTIERELENHHIKSIGWITREEVFEKYRKSILLFPSKIETFGMPLAEAKEFNSVILASDTEFSREILSDYKNAYFFNPNDEQELAKLMSDCIKGKIKVKINKNTENTSNENKWMRIMEVVEKIISEEQGE
ncbi:glycosyltransferase [Aerococcus urinaeequi]|uniref:glycosyltransferase n=1 Tax=Aerococcus urinaeequi TaxID=51665 RepID=UPI003D6C5899